MVLSGDDALLGVGEAVYDVLRVGGEDEVVLSGADEYGDAYALHVVGRHVGLEAHHAYEGREAVDVVVGPEDVSEYLVGDGAVDGHVGAAGDEEAACAGEHTFEFEGHDAAVAPSVDGRLVEADGADEGVDVARHVLVVIFGERLVGPLATGVEGIGRVARLGELTLHGLEVAMATAVAVEENDGVPLTLDGVEDVLAVEADCVGVALVVGAPGEKTEHNGEDEVFHFWGSGRGE